ncbi:MAG: hypothetical protein JXC36_09700, partial [Candidatus Atribacteria bacterium]|nr:hypothetical protein [Candidatus Atribacteria bacterium]
MNILKKQNLIYDNDCVFAVFDKFSLYTLIKSKNMRRLIIFVVVVQFTIIQYGQIIADHTVVDKYNEIPQYYIDEVKKMWLSYAGESHSLGIREGLNLLEA